LVFGYLRFAAKKPAEVSTEVNSAKKAVPGNGAAFLSFEF
jgi:hypothetical protein